MEDLKTDSLIRHASLRQLQILEAVARLGGYTRAARALHLTQPTVWMQVKKLSDVVDLPLFEQIGKQLHPTAAGRKILAAAQDILERLGQLDDDMMSLRGEVKGKLRISVVSTAKYFIPHLLGAFVRRYPDVEPCLVVTNREKMLQRLRSNEDDLLIMGKIPENLEVEASAFLDNNLVVVAPPLHPLTKKRSIPLQSLLEENFLIREPGSGTRMAIDQLFADVGLQIKPYMNLGSSEAIKHAVMSGLGLSVLSLHSLRLELAGNHIAVLDVEGFPLKRRWYAAYPKGKQLPLVARTFLDFLLQDGKDILQDIPEQKPTASAVRR